MDPAASLQGRASSRSIVGRAGWRMAMDPGTVVRPLSAQRSDGIDSARDIPGLLDLGLGSHRRRDDQGKKGVVMPGILERIPVEVQKF